MSEHQFEFPFIPLLLVVKSPISAAWHDRLRANPTAPGAAESKGRNELETPDAGRFWCRGGRTMRGLFHEIHEAP